MGWVRLTLCWALHQEWQDGANFNLTKQKLIGLDGSDMEWYQDTTKVVPKTEGSEGPLRS